MKKIITVVFLFLFVGTAVIGQTKLNLDLKRQLDSIMMLDQKYRDTVMVLLDPAKRDSIAKVLSIDGQQVNVHYMNLQNRIDASNIAFVEEVFDSYRYPGKSLVGEPSNEVAWNVIQHSDKIHKYIDLVKKAAKHGELPFKLYATMLDRDLMNQGKEQIYGSQLRSQKLSNGKNDFFVWPIKDPATVNERRSEAGFNSTVEENATRFNVVYRVVSLDEVKHSRK